VSQSGRAEKIRTASVDGWVVAVNENQFRHVAC
jgi:hypothetical protein